MRLSLIIIIYHNTVTDTTKTPKALALFKSTTMTTKQRIFSFCPKFEDYPLNRLLVECSVCTRFVAACCQHGPFKDPYKPGKPCHHYELVFTDGACSNNGLPNAKAGLGITMGRDDKYFWSIPVDEAIDPNLNARRTSQRAELLAAIEGLKKLHNVARNNYVVVTDSEYVVRGITEWLPSWRVRPSLLAYLYSCHVTITNKSRLEPGLAYVGRQTT